MEDNYLKNYGIMIPKGVTSFESLCEKADPNGVPIYADCPANGGLCACTGACRVIVGHDQDPIRVQAYRERVKMNNEALKARITSFRGTITESIDEKGIKTYSWNRNNQP